MAFSSDWMQRRGPELNGTCNAKNLPVSWSLLYANKLYIPLPYLPKNRQHAEDAGQQVMALKPDGSKSWDDDGRIADVCVLKEQ